jgi:anti-sigma factor ChrR (cupin superfamily)
VLTCREVVERSSALVDGELSWRERISIRLHVVLCHRCRGFLDALVRLEAVLPELPDEEVDPQRVERIAARVSGALRGRRQDTGTTGTEAHAPPEDEKPRDDGRTT